MQIVVVILGEVLRQALQSSRKLAVTLKDRARRGLAIRAGHRLDEHLRTIRQRDTGGQHNHVVANLGTAKESPNTRLGASAALRWDYGTDLLTRLPSHPTNRLEELLPENWKPVGN